MSRLKMAKVKDLGKIDEVNMEELKKIWGGFKFKYNGILYQFSKVFTDDGPDYEVKIDGEAKVLKEFDQAIDYLEKNIKENKQVEGSINMSRLKQANHVSPFMHEEVIQHIISEPSGIRTKIQQSNMAFVIAKDLMSALPLVPANEVLYNLVQDIEMGHYDDISTVEKAHENWDEWKERTKELLIAKGLLVKTSRLKKNIISEKISTIDEAIDFLNNSGYNFEKSGEIVQVDLKNNKEWDPKRVINFALLIQREKPNTSHENNQVNSTDWKYSDIYNDMRKNSI